MKWKQAMRPWYLRPLSCLLGMHQWRQHPGIPDVIHCPECHMERTK